MHIEYKRQDYPWFALTLFLNQNHYSSWTVGSECNGGFAEYTSIRSSEAFTINSNWTDAEIASIPCAYSTAEGLLHRSQVGKEKVFLIELSVAILRERAMSCAPSRAQRFDPSVNLLHAHRAT